MRQLLLQNEPDSSGRLVLNGKAYRYLIKVLRLSEGSVFPVVFPVTGAAQVTIELLDTAKKELVLKQTAADTLQPVNAEQRSTLILLQWVLKGSKNDTVIRQATEAGVRYIMPVIGEFSVAKNENPARYERYQRIIREARQQSGSSVHTEVRTAAPLAAVLNAIEDIVMPEETCRCVFTEQEAADSQSLHTVMAACPGHVVLAIGAEGGISSSEYALLEAAGFKKIHFQTNILRAETAALYAIAAAQTLINEADTWQLPEYTC